MKGLNFNLEEISTIEIALQSKYDFWKKYLSDEIYTEQTDFALSQIERIECIFCKLEEMKDYLIKTYGVIHD